jgi:hypothetical protein
MERTFAVGRDKGAGPAGENGVQRFAQLLFQSCRNAVHHGGAADDRSGAHAVHRIGAQELHLPGQVDAGQLRRVGGQGIHGVPQAGNDHPAI